MNIIQNKTFDTERALYGSRAVTVQDCSFDGPADGESAFKESSDVRVEHCFFNLRYPFWHDHGLKIHDSEMTELCRAALWYSDHIMIADTKLHGIWMVCPRYGDGGLHGSERIFYDAFGSSAFQICADEG